jgi:hypothetical protein
MSLLRRRSEGSDLGRVLVVDGAEHAERVVPPVDERALCWRLQWVESCHVTVTVAKALTYGEWFRDRGGHCIDCGDPFSPGVAP